MSRLKLGLIGCGRIAQSVHLKILTRLPQVELVAFAEPDARLRAAAARQAPQAEPIASYAELLAVSDLNAVVICVPNMLHAEVAIAALKAGKHIYLEKPLATGVTEGQAIIEAWQCAGVVGMIGFNYRYNKLYRALKGHIQQQRIGELVAAHTVFSSRADSSQPAWKQTRQDGGGVLFDLASHHIDLLRFCFGQEIRQVYAEVWSHQSEDDSALLQLRLNDDLPVQSFFSLSTVEEDRLEVYGRAGKMMVDRYRSFDVRLSGPMARTARREQWRAGLQRIRQAPYGLSKMRAPLNEPSYSAALAQFVTAARTHRPVKPDLLDALRSQEIIAAAERSARERCAVTLPVTSIAEEPVAKSLDVSVRGETEGGRE